jgi:hypothetical protein
MWTRAPVYEFDPRRDEIALALHDRPIRRQTFEQLQEQTSKEEKDGDFDPDPKPMESCSFRSPMIENLKKGVVGEAPITTTRRSARPTCGALKPESTVPNFEPAVPKIVPLLNTAADRSMPLGSIYENA